MIIQRRLAQTIRRHWNEHRFIHLSGPRAVGKAFLAERIFLWGEGGLPPGASRKTQPLTVRSGLASRDGTHLALERDWPILKKGPEPYVRMDPSSKRARFTLLPITLSELGTIPQNRDDFLTYLMRGGYPGGLDPRFRPGEFYLDLLAEWYSEIRGRWVRGSLMETFKEFMKLCAEQAGSILNCSLMARNLGVSQPLVRKWVDILIREHLAHLLPAYPESFGRRVVKTPKLYFWDTGVMCAALELYGWADLHSSDSAPVRETWLVGEIRKSLIHEGIEGGLFYWRDRRGLHLPLVLRVGSSKIAIALTEIPSSRDTAALREWRRMAGDDWDLVQAFSSVRFTDRHGVNHLPWHAVPDQLIDPIGPINRRPASDWSPSQAEPRFASLPAGASLAPHFFGR